MSRVATQMIREELQEEAAGFQVIGAAGHAPITIRLRQYRESDQAEVRRICCETGFLGEPIETIYQDRECFADLFTNAYLEYEPEGRYDLITMIMCDFCALSPAQRSAMLEKFRRLLSAAGRVVLDVYSLRAFESRVQTSLFGKDLMDGFWSSDPYFGFKTDFKYEADKVSLDKYTIVQEDKIREVYNWLQYFSPESLSREARDAGLEVEAMFGDVAGHPYDAGGMEFAVVLKA